MIPGTSAPKSSKVRLHENSYVHDMRTIQGSSEIAFPTPESRYEISVSQAIQEYKRDHHNNVRSELLYLYKPAGVPVKEFGNALRDDLLLDPRVTHIVILHGGYTSGKTSLYRANCALRAHTEDDRSITFSRRLCVQEKWSTST